MQEHYDEFFEEVFTELEEKYGDIEEMNVCDNLGDHLVGNVYVKVSIAIGLKIIGQKPRSLIITTYCYKSSTKQTVKVFVDFVRHNN